MSNIVEVRGVSKRFGDFEALRNVTFDIAPGSIVGLIGPNGAGKTTTLKSILGLTDFEGDMQVTCLLYTSPSPRDQRGSRMPSSA